MSRLEETISEKKAKEVFLKFLRTKETVSVSDEIIDSPDLVFSMKDSLVGCELTTITREQFERWIRDKYAKEDEFGNITIENRPDKWIKELLIKKNNKIVSYKENHSLDLIWLLVHTGEIPLFDRSESSLQIMRHEINKTPHDFNQIWFIGEKDNIEQLWPILPEHAKNQQFRIPTEIIFNKVKVKLGPFRTGIDFKNKKVVKSNS